MILNEKILREHIQKELLLETNTASMFWLAVFELVDRDLKEFAKVWVELVDPTPITTIDDVGPSIEEMIKTMEEEESSAWDMITSMADIILIIIAMIPFLGYGPRMIKKLKKLKELQKLKKLKNEKEIKLVLNIDKIGANSKKIKQGIQKTRQGLEGVRKKVKNVESSLPDSISKLLEPKLDNGIDKINKNLDDADKAVDEIAAMYKLWDRSMKPPKSGKIKNKDLRDLDRPKYSGSKGDIEKVEKFLDIKTGMKF